MVDSFNAFLSLLQISGVVFLHPALFGFRRRRG
jgi:hypothetical protein